MKTRKLKNQPPVSLEIREIGAKGDGVAEYNGRPVYVGKTAPGDVADIRLETEREDGYTGRLLSVKTPGPDRAKPPCPYYDKCGGCSLQHVTPEFYRDWKINKVKTALARAGVEYERWEDPVFLPHATRRRTTFVAHKTGKDIRLGYNEARTHNILDIPACMVLDPALDKKAKELRPFLPRLLPDNKQVDIMLQYTGAAFDLVLSGEFKERGRFSLAQDEAMAELAEKLGIGRISCRSRDFGPLETVLARRSIMQKFGALSVELPPAAFLQASGAGEAALVSIVQKYAGDAPNIADLFCGCGTFAGNLTKPGVHVYAADGDGQAIGALEKAAKGHDLEVERRDLFKNPLRAEELSKFGAVVYDPPRAGAREQTAELAKSAVSKIIAISCNPATFARDAKVLIEGGYKLKSLTLIDQFVWSAHVETAALFERS